jgi:hypothetical protein
MNAISLGHLPLTVHVVKRSIFQHATERNSFVAISIVLGQRDLRFRRLSTLTLWPSPTIWKMKKLYMSALSY